MCTLKKVTVEGILIYHPNKRYSLLSHLSGTPDRAKQENHQIISQSLLTEISPILHFRPIILLSEFLHL